MIYYSLFDENSLEDRRDSRYVHRSDAAGASLGIERLVAGSTVAAADAQFLLHLVALTRQLLLGLRQFLLLVIGQQRVVVERHLVTTSRRP